MTTTILTEKTGIKIAVVSIDELKPHEKGSPLYLKLLVQELLRDKVLKYPIVADERTKVILDGMHRWLALRSLGYTLMPVILVDALHTPGIRVGRRRVHRYLENCVEETSVEKVISAGLSGRLLKPRTTRHFFPFSKLQRIDYPLDLLGKRPPQDVSQYLSKMSKDQCYSAIEEWLTEISEELEFLAKRREEVEKEKQDFLNRVKTLETVLSDF